MNNSSVSLSKFNELRFPDDPVPLRTLRNWAHSGKLPGAFRPHETAHYRVKLAEYDKAMSEGVSSSANDGNGQSAEEIAAKIADQFNAA